MFVVLGSITFVLALIGIVVRGIPTTPLLLLTLFLYSKGSEKLEMRLRNSTLYKRFLEKYDQRKALTLKEKISIQIFAGAMMAISFALVGNIVVRVFLVLCFVIMNYVFIFKIKTYRPED